MSADVNEVCRLLDERGLEHRVTETGHEVVWYAEDGTRWSYYGMLYAGRTSRLTCYGVRPERAMEIATAASGRPAASRATECSRTDGIDYYEMLGEERI